MQDETVLEDGPHYALRAGRRPRNETDRDRLVTVVPGWPNDKQESKQVICPENKAQRREYNILQRTCER